MSTRITDEDIRLYSVSVECSTTSALLCRVALGESIGGVLAHLAPTAARALVELEIERLRSQGQL